MYNEAEAKDAGAGVAIFEILLIFLVFSTFQFFLVF